MVAYHDDEWGLPVHDEQRLFEMLCLEGAQAGLSWATILRRREGYRAAYEGFDAVRMAAWDDDRQARLLADTRIIRNRAKVRAFRDNAIAVLRLREEEGGLDGPALVGRRRDAHRQPLRAPGRAAGSHRALGAIWRAPLRPAASASWAPSSSTPTCSRSASSTTTWWAASGTRSRRPVMRRPR